MRSKLEWILAMITFILGYLYQSASNNRLYLLEKIFNESCTIWILSNSEIIIILLVSIYILIEIIQRFITKDIIEKRFCQNICQYIFSRIERDKGHEFMQNIRVSIFKADKIYSAKPKLYLFSRYQTRTPIKKSKIKFHPGKGCVGLCYQSQVLVAKQITEFEKNNKKYIKESKSVFDLDKKDVQMLNFKSSTFIGIPIITFAKGLTWGVLIVDSTKNTDNFEGLGRQLEDVINNYQVFFEEGGKS